MHTNEAILTALLVVLVLAVAFRAWGGRSCPAGCGCLRCRLGFGRGTTDRFAPHTKAGHLARAEANRRIAARTGVRDDGYHQPHTLDVTDMAEYHRRGHHITPEALEEAQRAAWYQSMPPGVTRDYDVTKGYYPGDDYMQYHTPGTAMDYGEHLTNLALDGRTHANHRRWVEEVLPWSQTALKVDDMDEAVYVNTRGGHGIATFRNDTPAQGPNTLFITEGDPHLHAAHSNTFRFNG